MEHYTTFQDVYISNAGIRVEFGYTKGVGNRWHVVAQVVTGNSFAEIYTAHDEKPESLEKMFATHRVAVAQLLTGLGSMIAVKGLM